MKTMTLTIAGLLCAGSLAAADSLTVCDASVSAVSQGTTATRTLMVSAPPGSTVDDVRVDILLDHTWLGDLDITLTHAGTTVALMQQPGLDDFPFGCGGRDVDAMFVESGTVSAEDLCIPSTPDPQPEPMIVGTVQPAQSFDAFDGLDADGAWVLEVNDIRLFDEGQLRNVCLTVTFTPPPPCAGDTDGSGTVDFDDLNTVLAQWGTAGPEGDVFPPGGGDGSVNFDDLNAVLVGWGEICP